MGAGIAKLAGLRIRLRSNALQGGFAIRPAKKEKRSHLEPHPAKQCHFQSTQILCYNLLQRFYPRQELDYVHIAIIGHLTRDILEDGYAIGGAVSYSGVVAHRLGADVTVLTRAHPDDVRVLEEEGIQVINLPTRVFTTFLNVYRQEIRTQQLLAVAGPILADEVPAELYNADVLLMAPVAQEVDPAIARHAKNMLAATPQGWMREWDSQGNVFAIPWYSSGRILPWLDTIIFSDLDLIGDLSIFPTIIDTVPLAAITKASKGCVLYDRGRRYQVHTRPAKEVDATGAGDTFTAAFLVELGNGKSPLEAAYFANVTASISVEGVGLNGIPYRDQVETYIQAHPGP